MNSKLDSITDWMPLFEQAHYRADELPALVQSSDRNLRRFFKERYGKPVQQLIDESRGKKAKLLLLGGMDEKTIINVLGFRTVQHFSRTFKERFGITPTQFRRTNAPRSLLQALLVLLVNGLVDDLRSCSAFSLL